MPMQCIGRGCTQTDEPPLHLPPAAIYVYEPGTTTRMIPYIL